jgi:mRNA-degrading endonuclease RelE of RelBE toxin-antitoxin system
MVDKITKALNKFTQKEKDLVKSLLLKINKNNFEGLDLKKLKGRNDIFRVRKGKIRIIYRIDREQIYLLVIEKRSDNTYNYI